MRFCERYGNQKPDFINGMQKHEYMWEENLGGITVSKQRIFLSPLDALPIHSEPYRAGPRQRELQREEVAQMDKVGVAESAVTECTLPLVFVAKRNEAYGFASFITE